MTKDRHFLRAWREHRQVTQSQLAAAVDTTGAVIALLESGDRTLTEKWLRRLSPALGVKPGFLLKVDPTAERWDLREV